MLPQLRTRFRNVSLVWADGGYTSRLVTWAKEGLHLTLQIVKGSDDMKGFVVLPRQWVVERSLGWLMRSRRLVRDYETLPASSEAFIHFSVASILMARHLARTATIRAVSSPQQAQTTLSRPNRTSTPFRDDSETMPDQRKHSDHIRKDNGFSLHLLWPVGQGGPKRQGEVCGASTAT
ncbi:transposase [Streptomyces sp. NPDC002992]|uniref:transposase n=1 Tax=Streptomyces sp. NPDC002992 TaxID=3154273 RepID=UPI0033B28176